MDPDRPTAQLRGKRLVLGVTGSIAAYQAVDLVGLLRAQMALGGYLGLALASLSAIVWRHPLADARQVRVRHRRQPGRLTQAFLADSPRAAGQQRHPHHPGESGRHGRPGQ